MKVTTASVTRTLSRIVERIKDLGPTVAGAPITPPKTAGLPADPIARAVAHLPEVERALRANLLGFWLPRCIDRTHGGYAINFDRQGAPTRRTSKGIRPHCGLLWLFAHAFREGHGGPELLEAAAHGFRFIADKMWDPHFGGFMWELDASGDHIIRGKKHLVGQVYPLFAVSEYYLASKEPEALRLAARIFDLIEARTHDDRFGGYLEFFNRDWTATRPDEIGYLSEPAPVKLMNSHLHVLEAYTTFYHTDPERRRVVGERLRELIRIQSEAVVRQAFGVCTDRYERDWTPRRGRAARRVSYGHNLENISVLSEACPVVGVRDNLGVYESMFRYSLKYGFDPRRGAFFEAGLLGRPANWRDMIWWVEAEALWAALRMFELTQNVTYLATFNQVWEFVRWAQIDWTHGEWYERVRRSGRAIGDKANIWKCGYHNGRALMECIKGLRSLRPATKPQLSREE